MGCIRLRTLSVRACCFLAFLHKGRHTGSKRVGTRDVCVFTPSDGALHQMCVRYIFVHFASLSLSLVTCESVRVRLPTQDPILNDLKH